jgi:hypothetical protein
VSARRFADIMGVAIDGHVGVDGKFVSVRVIRRMAEPTIRWRRAACSGSIPTVTCSS